MAHRIGWSALLAVTALALLLSGCDRIPALGGATHGTDREHHQAEAALARWMAAVKAGGGAQSFVAVGELTGQIGDWEEAVGDNNKRALMAGLVVAAAALPSDAPGEAMVRWADGTTRSIRPVSATQALADVRATAPTSCGDCVPLVVTAARLSMAAIQTSRGAATAPAWEFTIRGTSVRVTRIAVAANDGIAVVPPEWDANDPPSGISIQSAQGAANGTSLVVSFVGAPEPASNACGADYSAEAVESGTAVVVIVIPHEHGGFGACAGVGAVRTATVELARPLGDRAVLEVQQGLPVSVVLTP
ncbi:MAG TPA: hypothetical protein VFY18_04975 [Candidatus Limnocylindrales bacterium]|nr:hypothetical protein [Candidatus Limnocylindrales bacterium]